MRSKKMGDMAQNEMDKNLPGKVTKEKMEQVVIGPHCGELIKCRDNTAILRAVEPVKA
jgi:hypothetical protein